MVERDCVGSPGLDQYQYECAARVEDHVVDSDRYSLLMKPRITSSPISGVI